MGLCYGVIGRAFPGVEGDEPMDQYKKIVTDLSRGIDDRREIMTFNHPNLIHRVSPSLKTLPFASLIIRSCSSKSFAENS
jgi:thymidylate synthase